MGRRYCDLCGEGGSSGIESVSGEVSMRIPPLQRIDISTFFVAIAAFLTLAGAAKAADLLDVRLGVTSRDATRIVIDLSDAPDYAISGDDRGVGRISIDLKGVKGAPATQKGAGHVASFSVEPVGSDATRITFAFAKTAKIKEQFIIPPSAGVKKHRLVVDLATADKAAFVASLPSRYEDLTEVLKAVTAPTQVAAAEEPKPKPAPAPAKEELPIIVIDAGHGGADPGATGVGGVKEKAVTLAAAKKLAEILNAKGRYRIVMTRADDTRLDVYERSRLAREAGAQLFISLHADAFHDEFVRGGSIYTVSEEGRARSAQTAEELGDHDAFSLNLNEFSPEVSSILFDKAQAYTENNSSRFAEILVRNLKGVTPLINNTHRKGNLFVLLAPDVPAALFELAYMSNEEDVANLTSAAWRERTMTAVATAIDDYFGSLKNTRHASN